MKKAVLSGVGLLVCLSAAAFASYPVTDFFGQNYFGSPTSNFNVTGSEALLSVADTAAPSSFGTVAIVGYGFTPDRPDPITLQGDISRNGGDSDCGLLQQLLPGTFSAYFMSIDFQLGKFNLGRLVDGEEVAHLDDVAITGWDADETYHMEFVYNDGNMTGSLYDSLDQLVGSLSATDKTYTENPYCGFLASTNYTGLPGTGMDSTVGSFGNLEVVPEPATLLLLGSGLAMLKLRRRK